jgi:DHA3 family macrolide efflux protein-like MFS transporter
LAAFFIGLKDEDTEAQPFRWSRLSQRQKRAFSLYPIVAASCAQCTALLPGAGIAFGLSISLRSLVLSPALLLLMCKTNGQFLGPLVVRKFRLVDRLSDDRVIIVCLGLFLIAYAAAFNTTSLVAAGLAVIIAHLFSNVVFTLAFVAFKRDFPVAIIGSAAVRQYQIGGIIMAASSLICGALATSLTNLVAVGFGSFGLLLSTYVLRQSGDLHPTPS